MIYYVNEAATGGEVWNVVPFKSVGKIKFGDSKETVRKLFSKGYDCTPNPSKKMNADRFRGDNQLFHVYYDKNDKVGVVEIYEGITVKYNGQIVFPSDKKIEGLSEKKIFPHSNSISIRDERDGKL